MFIWLFLGISIFIWALSLSISFEYLYNADWFLFHKLWIIKIALTFLPIFWLIFLLFATFLSYYNFKHTEKWYKYSLIKIFWINILLSIILWIFIYFLWISHFIEWKIENFIPKYRWVLVKDKELRAINIWQNEESGLIIWEILNVNNNNLDFIDYNKKEWIIIISNKTDIKWRINLIKWERIKVMWERKDHNIFNASKDVKAAKAEVKTLLIDKNRIPQDIPDKLLSIVI
jgi:hypothetical protein